MTGCNCMLKAAIVLLSISSYLAIHIPKDVEILEGYEFDDSPEYYPTDSNYYEARSLLTGLNKSIRNRRSTLEYEQAKGIGSTSSTGTANKNQKQKEALPDVLQHKVNKDKIEIHSNGEARESNDEPSQMPKAERQIMDPDYDYYSQRHLASWNDVYMSPSVSKTQIEEEDTIPDASTAYRSRQARVNFVTQNKKDLEIVKEIPEPIITKVPPMKAFHESKYGVVAPAFNFDAYPSRSYDPYLRRYDR